MQLSMLIKLSFSKLKRPWELVTYSDAKISNIKSLATLINLSRITRSILRRKFYHICETLKYHPSQPSKFALSTEHSQFHRRTKGESSLTLTCRFRKL
jgi:hypothetical protein